MEQIIEKSQHYKDRCNDLEEGRESMQVMYYIKDLEPECRTKENLLKAIVKDYEREFGEFRGMRDILQYLRIHERARVSPCDEIPIIFIVKNKAIMDSLNELSFVKKCFLDEAREKLSNSNVSTLMFWLDHHRLYNHFTCAEPMKIETRLSEVFELPPYYQAYFWKGLMNFDFEVKWLRCREVGFSYLEEELRRHLISANNGIWTSYSQEMFSDIIEQHKNREEEHNREVELEMKKYESFGENIIFDGSPLKIFYERQN